MIRLSTLLLAPPVGKRLNERYRDYRQHGASWLSAALGCLWASLAWAFMPLETPRWQVIRERHGEFFPHINPHRPRPLDPIRYLLQCVWLLATRVPEPDKKINWRSLAAPYTPSRSAPGRFSGLSLTAPVADRKSVV